MSCGASWVSDQPLCLVAITGPKVGGGRLVAYFPLLQCAAVRPSSSSLFAPLERWPEGRID